MFVNIAEVAVSTGPAFIAGIGVGIAVLIVKSMFAPFLFGLKWMAYNLFFKESSPFDLMKMLFNMGSSDTWDSPMPPPSIDHYRPPPVHNHFDRRPPGRPPRPFGPPPLRHRPFHGPPGPPGPPPPYHHPPFDHHGFPPQMLSAPTAPGPSGLEHEQEFQSHPSAPPFDLNHQFTQPTPMIQTLSGSSPTMSQLEELYRNQLLEEGLGMKQPTYKSMLQPEPTNTIDMTGGGIESYDGAQETDHRDDQSYTPSTGLQAEVEHYDPFYSPLLSKIDLIFTYLGHTDEGCRERVVCSIYKFPVKYAPHSNLLSAQLSKHQTELKRPVTSSGKILRYFRYMKAAKDGQGGENCLDLYPKCNSDTDAVSSLPMIATFNQLSELMTAEASSPGVSLAAAG
ncbi:unnamed protein product [Orchesella dallaii]|uniref:Uncharacterized protein n=1 Tax=Orchesella dallaii TaxID=48710 RepID=A0ABP1R5W7_9HEXA